jgi:hypothetical protein
MTFMPLILRGGSQCQILLPKSGSQLFFSSKVFIICLCPSNAEGAFDLEGRAFSLQVLPKLIMRFFKKLF